MFQLTLSGRVPAAGGEWRAPQSTALTEAERQLLAHQVDLALEGMQYAWCRWHFTVLEMMEAFSKAMLRECARNPSGGYLLQTSPPNGLIYTKRT